MVARLIEIASCLGYGRLIFDLMTERVDAARLFRSVGFVEPVGQRVADSTFDVPCRASISTFAVSDRGSSPVAGVLIDDVSGDGLVSAAMVGPARPDEVGGEAQRRLGELGRYAGPATLILSSLADGPKHGYLLTKDIEAFSGIRLAPGTLYEALSRLQGQGLIEAVESTDRRRPYRLTAVGATVLRSHLAAQRRVADLGLRRLERSWGVV